MLALCVFGFGIAPAFAVGDGTGASTTLVAATGLRDTVDYDIDWYVNDPDSPEFLIQTSAELRGLSALVNGTAVNGGATIEAVSFQDKTIYLGGNIDLSEGVSEGVGFIPVGSPDHPFSGTFDGYNHHISNLRISETYTFSGLFGYASDTSTLRNVSLGGGDCGISLVTDSEYVGDVGSLVGKSDGVVRNCSSSVDITVSSDAPASASKPYTVQRVGGLVGYARGDMDGCSYTGDLEISVGADVLNADSSSESLRVADSFGGVVGRFGDPNKHGVLSNSFNLGNITVQTTGAGAVDRFGTVTYAVAFYVGGVAGYSNGSIICCHNGAYNEQTRKVTGMVFTGIRASDGISLANNRGADEVGGIVGSLRGNSEDPDKYNDGDPEDPMVVVDCYNEAQVTGLNATGGIVGQAGVYTTITRCYNGTITDLSDWTRNQEAGKVITTRWNKPLSGGIVGQTRSGVVSYCANYAEVRNIQTGYYMAGIAGGIFTSDDYPGVTGEIYACFNSGGIYTINTTQGVEYREAGICGDNEGNVHDCIVMEGSVPYHNDQAIGNMDWGVTSNLFVKSPTDLAKPESAAILNAVASQTQDWSTYWFINGRGYPVLNTWVESGTRPLTADVIASVEQLAPAPYVGAGAMAMPTLKVVLTDGTVLVQDTDFRVIPQPGAYEMSVEPIYTASIAGLGMYTGTVSDCARYGIAAADLSMATVQVSSMKYRFGNVVFPAEVRVLVSGSAIDADNYDYVIYNNATSAANVIEGKGFAVLDSRGYVSFDENGAVKIPLAEFEGGIAALNAETRDWRLYDRNGVLISDSAGNSYYPSGAVYGAGTSCVNLKSGTPAGYVVKVSAKDDSLSLSGGAIGYYVIEPVDLYRECTFEGATFGEGDDAQTWAWDVDKAKFYREANDGQRVYGASVTFTGEQVKPNVAVTCGGHTLVEGVDYRIICGDPNPSEAGVVIDETMANRNVTGAEGAARAAITIYPINTMNLSNYIIAYFDIEPAHFEDCEVSLTRTTWAYTGEAVEPDVKVTLHGVELKAGVDYQVTYANNVEKGQASYVVTPLANLSGGTSSPISGTFTIDDGTNLDDLTIDAVSDQPFNWGYDVHPKFVFRDGEGDEVPLVEGEDFTVGYSTANITKWPAYEAVAESHTTPCTATVTGKAGYVGTKSITFDIVPYNATLNTTDQLRAIVRDIDYGTWGLPAKATTKLPDGTTVPRENNIANVGPSYPVMAIMAYPIVDWAAYDDGDVLHCYGDPIPLTTTNNNVNGGLINRYPARYFDALGNEVNGNGAVYTDTNGAVIAQPTLAQPGPMTAKVYFRTGTSGVKGGATGYLTCGFVYRATADISTVGWTVAGGNCTYSGTALTPIVGTMTGSGATLVEGSEADYTIRYENNVNTGVATYAVTAIEGADKHFTGTYEGSFSILPADFSSTDGFEIGGIEDQACTPEQLEGDGSRPEPAVTYNGTLLQKDADYELSYRNNHEPGDEAYVRILGRGNYTGFRDVRFRIVDNRVYDLAQASISGLSNKVYNGSAQKLGPVVTVDGITLSASEGYTVSYLRNGAATTDFTNVGTITVQVTGNGGRCINSKSATYAITCAQLSKASVSGLSSATYDGAAKKPVPVLKVGGRTLSSGTDYTLSYTGNVAAGTAKVTATGKGNYAGTRTATFTIAKASIASATVSGIPSYTYDGSPKLPAPSLKLGNRWLAPGRDFKLSIINNRNAGKASVKATGIGNYTRTKTVSFTIAKANQPLVAKAKAKKVKVKLSKVKKKAFTTSATVKVSKAQGKVTYKNISAKKSVKKWKVNAKTGKVTVPKGTKKGTYAVKLRITAAGNANYKSGSKIVSFKIIVN